MTCLLTCQLLYAIMNVNRLILKMKNYQKTNIKRNKKILELREKGKSLREIASKFDLTAMRVSQIVAKAKVLDK